MEKKRKHLWRLTLISLIWGSAAFNIYADNDTNTTDIKIIKKVVVSTNKEKPKKEKEVKPVRPLKRAMSEEAKFTGEVSFEGAKNLGLSYPARTDFMPSLIATIKSDEVEMNVFSLDVAVKLGARKKFIFEDEVVTGGLELKAVKKDIKLSQIYLTWQGWTAGITTNNFCNIGTFSSVKVTQVSWKKSMNDMFSVGLGIEEAKEFNFYGAKEDQSRKETAKNFKPRKDIPAASARLQYNLPNGLGSTELSGLFRPLGWYNSNKKTTEFMPGFGVNLGGKINVRPETDILTTHFIYGQGIGEYVGDLIDLDNEPISMYVNNGTTKSIAFIGGYLAYEHHWTPSLRSTFGGGLTTMLNDYNKDNKYQANFYKFGAYGKGNLMYWLNEHTSFGLEYAIGYRKNANESKQETKGADQIKAIFEFKI